MAMIKCSDCGKDISDKAVACPNCGCPVEKEALQDDRSKQEPNVKPGMLTCGNCGSNNINVQISQTGATSTNRAKSGAYKLGRDVADKATLGVYGFVKGAQTGTSKTRFTQQKYAICLSCGHSWAVYDKSNRASKTATSVIAILIIVSLAAVGVFANPSRSNSSESENTAASSASEDSVTSKNAEKDFADDVQKALQFNLDVANEKYNRPSSMLDEDTGGYYGLLGILTAYKANDLLLDDYKQEYRTFYYALHWKGAYIDEFGEDSFMEEAENYIAAAISEGDMQKINDYFASQK